MFDVTDYGATGDGATDDTAAVQAAIDACAAAGGGDVFFPVGEYVIAGPVLEPGGRNAQLLLPTVPTSVPHVTIRLLGACRPPYSYAGPRPTPGCYSVIRSTLTGASGTAACISGGNQVFTAKNNLQVIAENLLCLAPDDASFTFFNLSSCQGGAIRDVMITMASWSNAVLPTHANSYGVRLPQRGQSNYTHVEGLCVYVFYTGVQIGELTVAQGLIFGADRIAVEATPSPHPWLITEMHQTGCGTGIRVVDGAFPSSGRVLLYNAEHMPSTSGGLQATQYDFDDPDDNFRGDVTWGTASHAGPVDHVFNVNGGAGGIFTELGAAITEPPPPPPPTTPPGDDVSILSVLRYRPSGEFSYDIPGSALSDVTAGAALSFVAPESGNVLVDVAAFMQAPNNGQSTYLGLREGSTVVAGPERMAVLQGVVAKLGTSFLVTGLSPGSTHTYKLAASKSGGAAGVIYWGGQMTLEMTVRSAP